MTKYFDILNRFMGYGAPTARIWFIGIEEGGEPWKKDPKEDIDYYEKYKQRILPVAPGEIKDQAAKKGRGYTQTYLIMSKILVEFRAAGTDPTIYRNELLYQPRHEVFSTNLYPLGKPHEMDWPEHYDCLFGLSGRDEYQEKVKDIENGRFGMLRALWKAYCPLATICFGKGHWDDFRFLFDLNEETEMVVQDASIRFHKKERIILTYFFDSRFMNGEGIRKVVEIMKSFGWKES